MNLRRWGVGGVIAVSVVAAACGGSGGLDGDSDAREPAAPSTSAVIADSQPEQAQQSAPEQATEQSVTDQAAQADEPVVVTAVEQDDPATVQETVDPADLFLPPDATVTPEGDAIIRDDSRPVRYGGGWGTNWGIRTIDLDEILSGGVPRDGIPSIDDPKFISLAEADEIYSDNSPVVQFEVNGDVRAYPLSILIWHEIVNDVVGGVPVGVTFCPLCNTAIAFDRRVGGDTFEFGTSGLLRNSDLVMYDRTTETLWQQIGGDALIGNMVGAKLDLLPASIVSWAQFRDNFADGIVLSTDTGSARPYGDNPYSGYDDVNNTPFLFVGDLDSTLSPFERVVTLDFGSDSVAYPFTLLEDVRLVSDTRNNQEIVVFWTPGSSSALDTRDIDSGREVGSSGVFDRSVDDTLLSFVPNPDDDQTFLDSETNSVWNIFGKAVAGAMEGQQLTPVVHANHFWFAWAAFQPETEVFLG